MLNVSKAVTALEFAATAAQRLQGATAGSYIEYTQPTRVEPPVLVDLRSSTLPYIEDVLHTALNLFSAYYLLAVHFTVEVGNINVLRLLDKLNPDRDATTAVASSNYANMLSRESASENVLGLPFPSTASMENLKDNIAQVTQNTTLSVGKLIEVTIVSGESRASFPVMVRFRTNTMTPELMTHTLSLEGNKVSMKERWHGVRSGQLRFVRDFMLGHDLIKEHQRNALNDASGYYQSQMKRSNRNFLSALFSGTPSVARMSAVLVMNDDTAKELEHKIRGKLSNFNVREKLFEESRAMLMFIIHPEWETVTIYHQSIERPTEVTVREIQRGNKGNKGPDILEVLNALKDNKAPSF